MSGNDNDSGGGQTPPPDPTITWPARWDGNALFWTAAILFAAWGSVIGLLAAQFSSAGWFDKESDISNGPMTFGLLAIGVLLLFAGAFFVLYESKQPPTDGAADINRRNATVDPAGLLKGALETLKDAKASAALFAMGFALVVLAAAGSGLISISVGEQNSGNTGSTSTTVPVTTQGGS